MHDVKESITSDLTVFDPVEHPPAVTDSAEAKVERKYVDEIVLGFLSFAALACWMVLRRHYGLFANRDNTHFAFEKIPGGFHSETLRQTAGIFILLGLIYFITFWIIRTTPALSMLAKVLIGTTILGPAIVNVLLYPVGALDVFNYMIELKLTYFYHENPYLVTFEGFRDDSFALPAFLVNVPLFYGPVWLLFSWLPTVFVGFESFIRVLVALKIFNAMLLFGTAILASRFHADPRKRWLTAFLVLANPLVLFEGIANVHNDVMMTFFLVAAVLALKKKSVLAGPLLVLATLVKFYPLALAPLFVVRVFADRWGWRKAAISAGLSIVALIAVVAPYWSGGDMVDGLRDGIDQSQEMDHVSIFSLAQQYEQQRVAEDSYNTTFLKSLSSSDVLTDATRSNLRNGFAVAFIVFAVGIALSTLRGRSMELAAVETLLLFLLLQTNLYPWYLIPIIALVAVQLDRIGLIYLFIASALGLFYYPMYVYGHFNSGWERFHVHLFLALFLTAPVVLYLAARPFLFAWNTVASRVKPALRHRRSVSLPASQ